MARAYDWFGARFGGTHGGINFIARAGTLARTLQLNLEWIHKPGWRNGRRSGLKLRGRKAWGFESPSRHQSRRTAVARMWHNPPESFSAIPQW